MIRDPHGAPGHACTQEASPPRVMMAERVRRHAVWTWALAALPLAACAGDTGIPPQALRFGQLGEIEVHLEAPLQLGAGQLDQDIRWGSSGAWSLQESILYHDVAGDGDFVRNPGSPDQFASYYASLITQVNDQQGLQLDIPELPQDTMPTCGPVMSRITFTIHDNPRNADKSWTRCAYGSLGNLTPEGAGPDPAASRVALAAVLARNYTVGENFVSAYSGSVPFATLDRGEDTPATLTAPMSITDQRDWASFWQDHTGGKSQPPTVDFDKEMVIVAAVGKRSEAGDSVEVRRILQVDQGTLVHIWERIPGDFCSPVARSHTPFHIVVSPRTPLPIRFAEIHPDTVRCGALGG
jgi:hypothetical protein